MTINQTRSHSGVHFEALAGSLRRGLSFAGRLILAAFIIIAAGILAVATAVAGLVLAVIALVIGLLGRRRLARAGRQQAEPGAGVTLDARRTARGWTVE